MYKNNNNFLNKFAKTIRIITIPPIMAITLITCLYIFKDGVYNNLLEYFNSIITIALIPILAYPLQAKFKILKKEDARENQRNLAVIFSLIGYFLGTCFALIMGVPSLQQVVHLTYLFSGIIIFFGTFIIKIKFSGHMCGISGPIVVIAYALSYYFLFLYIILFVVFWASLYLKRHSISELVLGTIIPVISFIIAILIL